MICGLTTPSFLKARLAMEHPKPGTRQVLNRVHSPQQKQGGDSGPSGGGAQLWGWRWSQTGLGGVDRVAGLVVLTLDRAPEPLESGAIPALLVKQVCLGPRGWHWDGCQAMLMLPVLGAGSENPTGWSRPAQGVTR